MTALAHLATLPLVHTLGWTLLHFCWQGAIVALLLACVLALVPSRASRLRYAVALAALLLLAILPVITFSVLERNIQPASGHVTFAAGEGNSVLAPEPWTTRFDAVLNRSLPAVLAFWLAGVLIQLCRLNVGLMVTRRMKALAVERAPAEMQSIVRSLRTQLGIERAVQLLHSARVQAPVVIGWLRPAILLPLGCMTGLSTVQIEAILAHELAHIRRHDYLVSLFQSVMEAVLFYHPAVWWVSKQIRREREHCCDDLAVAICGDRLAYAKALTFLEQARIPMPACALGATGGVMKLRITRLLGINQSTNFPRTFAAMLLVLAGVSAGLAAVSACRAKPATEQQSTSTGKPGAPTQASDGKDQNSILILDQQSTTQEQSSSGRKLYKVGKDVSAPVALFTPEAEFTDEARRAKYQGVCILGLVVDAQGNPQEVHVVRSLGMGLNAKALEAVRKYRFKPAMKDGKTPVPVYVNVEVNFRLY